MNVLSDLIQRNSVSKHKQWDTETIGTRRYKQMGRAGLHVKKKKKCDVGNKVLAVTWK